MSITTRSNPAVVKVICVGLGRTGTMSLRDALAMLGFGPCYHLTTVKEHRGKDLPTWSKIGDGKGTPEDCDNILRGYGCILDYPPAMYHAELLAAYPDAKFILTTRDPAKWEKSMKNTILPLYEGIREAVDQGTVANPEAAAFAAAYSRWTDVYIDQKYHHGRLQTHTQEEFMAHIERVKKNIPADKLLLYEVGEGWDRLVDFLGVPKPETPFPNINNTAAFQATFFAALPKKNQPNVLENEMLT